MTRKIKIEVEVPIVKTVKAGTKTTSPIRYNVQGMMSMIKRTMKTKEQQDLLEEYAKFYMLNEAGVKEYPLSK